MKKYLDKCFWGNKKNVIEDKYPDVKILIDNGHGIDTLGKCSPYTAYKIKPEIDFREYKWNREISVEVVSQLMEMGYNASLLVPEENDISLSDRVKRINKICEEYGNDKVILISIHANAAGNGLSWYTAQGWSAFTTKGKTKSDKISEYLYAEAENNFKDRKIRKDMSDGDKDWESNFYIIKNSKCPAVITENFFYDNVDDVKYILSEEGKKAVIKTHVDGIINYIKDTF
jgi:N-acetylmuramoyl-L-alanine amidase